MSSSAKRFMRSTCSLLCAVMPTGPLLASTVTVTSPADSGAGTFRTAVVAANSGDTIAFNLGSNATITLASTITIDKNLTIDGAGSPNLRIVGSGGTDHTLFVTGAAVTAAVDNLYFTGSGDSAIWVSDSTVSIDHVNFILNLGNAGALNNDFGHVAVSNSYFASNQGTKAGAIETFGPLTISSSQFRNNRSNATGSIYASGTTVSVTNSSFIGNQGGTGSVSFDVLSGSATIASSTFQEGTTALKAGASASVTVSNSVVTCSGTIVDGGYNVSSSNGCAFTAASSKNNTNPALSMTLDVPSPQPGSPLIDAGIGSPNCPALDERGMTRPQGARCDIGAFEAQQLTITANPSAGGRVSSIDKAIPATSNGIVNCTSQSGACSAVYVEGAEIRIQQTPDTGFHLGGFSGCGGSLSGSTFITAPLTASCVLTVTFAPNTHSISGTIGGVAGSGLVLHLDYGSGTEDLPVAPGSTSFAFASPVPFGATYAIGIGTQPQEPDQTCAVTNDASGTMPNANVGDVAVACANDTFVVGGVVSNATGAVQLELNSTNPVATQTQSFTNGAFQFATPLSSGSNWTISVTGQPAGQSCSATSGSGTDIEADVGSVGISCITLQPQLGLTISDSQRYAAYGKTLSYVVTLGNTGTATSGTVPVSATTSAGLDMAHAAWSCVPTGGATCSAQGTGAFTDNASVPVGGLAIWVIGVPVFEATGDPTVQMTLSATGATSIDDIDTLVIFRDGFAPADGE